MSQVCNQTETKSISIQNGPLNRSHILQTQNFSCSALKWWKMQDWKIITSVIFGASLQDKSIYTVSQKGCHLKHCYNFVNSRSSCNILSLLQKSLNFQQNPSQVKFTNLRLSEEYLTFVQADYVFGPISDRTLSTLQLTSGESVSRHVSVQMVDILNPLCEQT